MNAQPLSDEFGPFEGRVWLDCAHQGPLPRAAAEAAGAAIEQKVSPHLIRDDAFWDVPFQLKETIGSLINAPADELILGNSTSYGLNLLAQGLPWNSGDEVLVVEGDFPASVVTWLPLVRRGVQIRFLRPASGVPHSRGGGKGNHAVDARLLFELGLLVPWPCDRCRRHRRGVPRSPSALRTQRLPSDWNAPFQCSSGGN
jgi:hypothetical protein